MIIDLQKLSNGAKLPTRGSTGAAGYDLYAMLAEDPTNGVITFIQPHETKEIRTGIKIAIPSGYCGLIYARSGIARSRGLRPANCVGVIDSDYRGEIKIALHNDTNEAQQIQNGERVAQLVITPCVSVRFAEVVQLNTTERGEGGFGSTGN